MPHIEPNFLPNAVRYKIHTSTVLSQVCPSTQMTTPMNHLEVKIPFLAVSTDKKCGFFIKTLKIRIKTWSRIDLLLLGF